MNLRECMKAEQKQKKTNASHAGMPPSLVSQNLFFILYVVAISLQ
jgi:hypothetical protein